MKKYGEHGKTGGMGLGEAYKALYDLHASVRKIFEPEKSSIEAQLEAHKKIRSNLMSTLMNNRPLDHYI